MSEKIRIRLNSAGRLDVTLLRDLKSRNTELSLLTRSRLAELIRQGFVSVETKKILRPAYHVEAGLIVELDIPKEDVNTEPVSLERVGIKIIHFDQSIVVVDKPAGVVVHPGAGTSQKPTLVEILSEMFGLAGGETQRSGVVHRLDKDTSGVMVLARSPDVHAALSNQFASREVSKIYRALVCELSGRGTIFTREDRGIIDLPIGRDPVSRTKMQTGHGRKSSTEWEVLNRFNKVIELKLFPKTGRTHQIRVHLAANAAPIVGDKTYGASLSELKLLKSLNKVISRQALHAESISFVHPLINQSVTFNAPLPADYQSALKVLKEN